MFRRVHVLGVLGSVVVGLAVLGSARPDAAYAQSKLRVAKAIQTSFSFLPVDVGAELGMFKKHGVTVDITSFPGGSRAQQALVGGSIDVELGSGPELALIAKGAPTIAIGAINGAPHLTITVRASGPIHSVADLKGRKIGITAVASVAQWLPRELSRRQGWGPNGMQLIPLGLIPTQIAAMKRGEIDGMVLEFATASLLEQQGVGRIIDDFSKLIPNFHENIFYVRNDEVAPRKEQLRNFLAGWFDSVRYMAAHKAETVKIAQKVLGLPESIASQAYDAYMPGFSRDGCFSPAALKVLSQSFVDLGVLPSEPDTKKLYTEALLPGGSCGK